MANIRKRISELTALESASLQTTLVGVDNGTTYKVTLDVLEDAIISMVSRSTDLRLDSLELYTASFSASTINGTISSSTQISDLGFISSSTEIPIGTISSSTQISDLGFISSSHTDITSLNSFTQSFSSSQSTLNTAFINGISARLQTSSFNDFSSSVDSRLLAATNEQDLSSFATTGSNTFVDNQTILGFVTASSYLGNGRYLDNLPATTNWNYNQEFTIKKTEQLTFSGDYVVENTYLEIEGGLSASIGEWVLETFDTNATYTRNSNNQYTIVGPTGDNNASIGVWMHRQFDTNTTMSINYVWNGEDVGNDWPIYAVDTQYPYEINTENRLQNTNAVSESGTWTINVPSGSWLAIGVNTMNNNSTSGSLQITLPYIPNEDITQYSSNKYFKKEGSIFIGGNLLVKDSYIVNNGKISVGGEVILIGNSQIVGTGKII